MTQPSWTGAKPVAVTVDTLDSVVDRAEGPASHVLFAKVDAQGHDPAVLRGARRLLESKRIKVVAFEVWPNGGGGTGLSGVEQYVSVVVWLHSLGYHCADCSRPVRAGIAERGPWPVREVLHNLSDDGGEHRGVHVGSWTNFVCFSSWKELGSARGQRPSGSR